MITAALLMALQPVQPGQMISFGVGGYSCARAMRPEVRSDAFAWTMGYFTGRNQLLSVNVQSGGDTDGWGLFGEVEQLCAAQPSMTLLQAAHAIFVRHAGRRR